MPLSEQLDLGALVRPILLAHLDPVFASEVLARLEQDPLDYQKPEVVLFGRGVDPRLHRLLVTLIAKGLARPFDEQLVTVLAEAQVGTEGAREVLASVDLVPPVGLLKPGDPLGLGGVVGGPDVLCDLLLQPVSAFNSIFGSISENPIYLADRPDLAKQVFYRTQMSQFEDAALEVLMLEELGLNVETGEMGDLIAFLP